MSTTERLRFAPSPTGDLHIGGARAALFNWLYAQKTGGKFLLRIEDTDRERSTDTALESILSSMKWLGMNWDDEPVKQSDRGELYKDAVKKLLASGDAYPCYCTKEELEAEREHARAEKLDYHYMGKCRNLDPATVALYNEEEKPFTIRFKVPDGETSFGDHVHGETTFKNESIGDFIIARPDGTPVYLLAVAVDDADMGITIVMRGDDHISNTPKQIMLMNALDADIPRFAHLPQVLGMDKKKLSKRHGAASVMEYEKMGLLPEAVVNFITLLGWNPGDDREKMELSELIEAFSLEHIAKKSGVFDMTKLEWLNGQYLNELSSEDLFAPVIPLLVKAGYISEGDVDEKRDYLLKVITLLKERCRLLPEFVEKSSYFFTDPLEYDAKGEKKQFKDVSVADRLEALAASFDALGEFTEETAEEVIRAKSEELEIGAGKLIHPTRLAVSGTTQGPGLFEMLITVGRERTVARMLKAASYVREKHS